MRPDMLPQATDPTHFAVMGLQMVQQMVLSQGAQLGGLPLAGHPPRPGAAPAASAADALRARPVC
eukprot:919039-Alexandrium_andersonii.AAC.1